MTQQQLNALEIGKSLIVCKDHPQWGAWGIVLIEDLWLVIRGRSGTRTLNREEAIRFWSIAPNERNNTMQTTISESKGLIKWTALDVLVLVGYFAALAIGVAALWLWVNADVLRVDCIQHELPRLAHWLYLLH